MAIKEIKIKLHPASREALDGIVAQSQHSANPMHSIEELTNFVLMSLADGANRPGSWERDILEKMGFIRG